MEQFPISERMAKLIARKREEGSLPEELSGVATPIEKQKKQSDIEAIVESLDNPAAQAESKKILGETESEGEEEKQNRKEKITQNLEFVLGKVPALARSNPTEHSKYMEKIYVAKKELVDEDIYVDEYIWAVEPGIDAKERNKQLGQHKAELREIVRKMRNGEGLTDEENEIAQTVNIKTEDLVMGAEKEERREEQRQEDVVENIGEIKVEPIPNVVVEAEKKEKFSEREEAFVIQNCLDQVFVQGKNNSFEIIKGLLGKEGYIAVKLRGGKETPLSDELVKKIEDLGLDNWIAMRNLVSHWADFKGTEEIKPSTLTSRLFLDEYTERFFANSKCTLPVKNEETGVPELREVDLGTEIGMAMKKMRGYFEGSIDVAGNPVAEGQQKPKEYWIYIGADLAQKQQLYTDLGLDRYVAETAFSLLLSYQMLTDTSAEDFFIMMVNQAKGRTRKYKISEDRDPYVRMMVQEDLTKGKEPFTRFRDDEFLRKRKETEDRMAMLLPVQLIPTGLSGDGKEHLQDGDWLKWQVNENLFTRTQLEIAKANGESIKSATDQGTRLDMMRSALAVLTLMKEVQDPAADISKLSSIVGKLYSHMTGSFGDAYWLGPNRIVPADFTFKDRNGVLHDMPLAEWVSKTMLSISKTFLYTHSIVDHKNSKPLEMGALAENAENLFKIEVQSEMGSFVGMSEAVKREHRNELVKFVDRLWNNSYDLVGKINKNVRPDKYPVWYRQGASVSSTITEVAKKAGGSIGDWLTTKRRLRL